MSNRKTNTTARINKQKEIEQKRRRKRKIILITICVIAIIVGVCAYLLNSEKFKITGIIITGNNQLTQEEIYELSEVNLGDNLFATQEIVVKVKLKQNGYIEDVKIEKTYPNKIEIIVQEREKEFQIQTETGCYIYIDGQGHILDYSLDKLELITIVGMNITENEIENKTRLDEIELDQLENILQIREGMKSLNISQQITQIQVGEEYITSLENEGININFGDATNLKNKIIYVKSILQQEAGNQGTIYVNGDINAGFTPYFRTN